MRSTTEQQLERARLALVAADQGPLGAARHAEAEEPAPPEASKVSTPPEPTPWWRSIPKLNREHLPVVVALLVLVGLITLYAFGRSSATELPDSVVTPVAASSSVPVPSPSPSVPSTVRVHVLGAVVQPGVVSVAEGAIVQDVIQAAGGLADDADPGELNLAARVSDGQQIIIGTRGSPRGEMLGASAQPGVLDTGGGAVSLNQATTDQLQTLPGVGPVLAQAIIAWRDENGPFTDVAQLQEVSGIGPKTYERLAPLVTP
ncbi:MAG: ComEA family DNA-binding protein [Propionibacteriaceae bacterium]|nr:ComEA family DNA-binding protein [Propionibacteriaceae bacterium]